MAKRASGARRPEGKDGRKFDKEARKLGFEPVRGKGHIVYQHPSGATVTSGTAINEMNAKENLRMMRKALEELGVDEAEAA